MKEFNSLLAFSEHLIKAATAEIRAIEVGLEVASKVILSDAINQIAHLQPEVGSFPSWEELAESTKDEKERLGYVFNDDYNPLFRTGENILASLRYDINISGLESIIGSTSPIAAFQEFGTRNIPPRPFIGTAAFKAGPLIAKIFGAAMMIGLAGGHVIASDIGRELGYHQDIKL